MPVREDKVTEFRMHGWNPFYDGWLANLFGLPYSACPEKNSDIAKQIWRDGWKTAEDTPSLSIARYVLHRERTSTHQHIHLETVERRPFPRSHDVNA